MDDHRIGVVGCSGRMGRRLLYEITQTPGCVLAGGTVKQGNPHQGDDLGSLAGLDKMGIYAHTNTEALFDMADVVIDFTYPDALDDHLRYALHYKKALVIGTTGLRQDQKDRVTQASSSIPILMSPNMSLGITLLRILLEKTAQILTDDYDIEVVDFHHRHKRDAPSGTALSLIKSLNRGRKRPYDNFVYHNHSGPRKKGDIGLSIMRGGSVVGEHTVCFAGEGEVIEFHHYGLDRHIYAIGAVKAAIWLHNQSSGLFSMKDVLNMNIESIFKNK